MNKESIAKIIAHNRRPFAVAQIHAEFENIRAERDNLKRSIDNAHKELDKSLLIMSKDKSAQGLNPRIKSLVIRSNDLNVLAKAAGEITEPKEFESKSYFKKANEALRKDNFEKMVKERIALSQPAAHILRMTQEDSLPKKLPIGNTPRNFFKKVYSFIKTLFIRFSKRGGGYVERQGMQPVKVATTQSNLLKITDR